MGLGEGIIVGLAALHFQPWDRSTWTSWYHYATFSAVLLVGVELLALIVRRFEDCWAWAYGGGRIPVRGRWLAELKRKDWAFVLFNKWAVCFVIYHLLGFAWWCGPSAAEGAGGLLARRLARLAPTCSDAVARDAGAGYVLWEAGQATVANTLGSLASFFVFYDACYHPFHRFLHVRWMYGFVHKHHHQQMAPSRAQTDAVNVHPFEYLVGEYLHLAAVYLSSALLGPCHGYAIVGFLLFGGIAASLNHTRFDVTVALPFGLGELYSVRYHDQHHVVPNSNYGQYTMLWDHVTGTFLPHPGDAACAAGKKKKKGGAAARTKAKKGD